MINETLNTTSISVTVTNEHWKLFVSLISISTLCLLVTIIIFLMIWDKHNYQGWTQFSYLLSLFLFNVVFLPALCPGLTEGTERNMTCMTISILNQYSFISSKMWLIVISIDLYSSIKNLQITAQGTTKNFRKFFIYSVIGWILPGFFVTTGIIMNWKNRKKLLEAAHISDDGLWVKVPDYGYKHCRIPNWIVWEYFVIGNCLFHFFMFGLINFTICHQRQSFSSTESSTTRKKQSPFSLMVRLFIVVGLSWSYIAIQDMLSAGNINTKQNWAWHVFRCVFFLQGTFISAIIVSNGRTLNNLDLKYPKWKEMRLRLTTAIVLPKLRCRCFKSSQENDRKESIQSYESQRTIDTIL